MLIDQTIPKEQRELHTTRNTVAYHVQEILRLVGEDISRDGLIDTPERVAKLYEEMLEGMAVNPESILNTTFEDRTEGPVIVSDITFYSLCEHHMAPFFGKAHVAYLPSDKIVGISKLARLVDVFSKRLQVQERMTEQIVDTIDRVLRPVGVIALLEAEHTCMCARGVKKPGAMTTTLSTRGEYQNHPELRREFLQMIGK